MRPVRLRELVWGPSLHTTSDSTTTGDSGGSGGSDSGGADTCAALPGCGRRALARVGSDEVIRRVETHTLLLLRAFAAVADGGAGSQPQRVGAVSQPDRRGGSPSRHHAAGPRRPSPLLQALNRQLVVLALLYRHLQTYRAAERVRRATLCGGLAPPAEEPERWRVRCVPCVTQRDVYYRCARRLHATPQQVYTAIQQLVVCLGVPRESLRVVAGARGRWAGNVWQAAPGLRPRLAAPDGAPLPASLEQLRAIRWGPSGDAAEVERPPRHLSGAGGIRVAADTRAVLVIEKDAVFQHLVQETRFFQRCFPCVFVTSDGFPTLAARALLRALSLVAPPSVVFAMLCDYNPSGMLLTLNYKLGWGAMAENRAYRVPRLRWLGIRGSQIQSCLAPAAAGAEAPTGTWSQALTAWDRRVLDGLVARLDGADGEFATAALFPSGGDAAVGQAWRREAQQMRRGGRKVDLEAFYHVRCVAGYRGLLEGDAGRTSGFAAWVARALLQQDYLA